MQKQPDFIENLLAAPASDSSPAEAPSPAPSAWSVRRVAKIAAIPAIAGAAFVGASLLDRPAEPPRPPVATTGGAAGGLPPAAVPPAPTPTPVPAVPPATRARTTPAPVHKDRPVVVHRGSPDLETSYAPLYRPAPANPMLWPFLPFAIVARIIAAPFEYEPRPWAPDYYAPPGGRW
jgi:hypothetical protein